MNKLKRSIPDTLAQKYAIFFFLLIFLAAGCNKNPYNFNELPETVKGFFTLPDGKNVFDIDEQIQLTNKSENAESYSWDFGDGTKSTDKDPVKSYASSGIYTITLKAVGPGGTGTYSETVTIKEDIPAVTYKELFYIELGNDLIKKISLEPGSAPETVADITGKGGVGLAWDSANKKIYFSDFEDGSNGKIWRMNEDGSNMEELVSGIVDPYSIAINLKGGKIYWADDDGNISRANLDGSNAETAFIHIDDGMMRGIAYDSKKDIIYFYEVNDENLYAAKSDGTGVSKIVTGAYGYAIFVDEVNGKLYFEDRNIPAIMQANLDGSGIVKIADAPGTRIHGMAIDYSNNKFYWADRDKGIIRRANLDGSGMEPFLTNVKSPRGIFIK